MSGAIAQRDIREWVRVSDLGDLLQRRRGELGLTQEQLEELSSVSQNSISQIETGETLHPRALTIARLSRALGLPTSEFHRAMGWAVEPVTGGGATEWIGLWGRVPADAVRWTDMQHKGESVEVPRTWVEQARSPLFAVTVTGDCLRGCDPAISNGDVVVCQSRDDQDGPVRSGQIVLARVGSEYSLKVMVRTGARVELRDGDGNVVHTLTDADDYQILGTFYKRYTP